MWHKGRMKDVVIYLIGFPATGKYSIAKEICSRNKHIRLVDNHLINNPVFSMLNLDSKIKISTEVWNNVSKVWDVVCDTIIHHSPSNDSFVFTNVLLEGEEVDVDQYKRIKNVADKRGAKFFPVILHCSLGELSKRIVSEGRKERMKMLDIDGLKKYYNEYELIDIKHDNLIVLDNTHLSIEECTQEILGKINDRED